MSREPRWTIGREPDGAYVLSIRLFGHWFVIGTYKVKP